MANLAQADFARLVELLPWYVNGSIGPDDRAWVDACLAAHPQARQELAWFKTLSNEISVQEAQVPVDIGFQRAIAKVRADAAQPASKSRWQRLVNWLAERTPRGSPRFAPALAALAAIVVLQTGFLTNLLLKPDATSTIRSSAKGWADGTLLRVNFKPDARESEIRLLLVEVQAVIVAGPTTLGDYYIKVASSRIDAAAARLKANAVVESVGIAPSLPDALLER